MQSNAPRDSGLVTAQKASGESYWCFERFPVRIRVRLAEATLPICPVSLYAYWRKGVDNGYDPAFVEQKVIEAIERTEKIGAENLERDRATWKLGEAMAASVKVSLSRLRGNRAA